MTSIGIGTALRFPGNQTPLQKILNGAKTILPLLTSTVAQKGSNLTLTRADATPCATVVDFEGLVRVCKTNEIRMTGARRVENKHTITSSEVFSGWTKAGSATTPSANTLNLTTSGDYISSLYPVSATAGKTVVAVWTLSGSGTIHIQCGNNVDQTTQALVTLTSTPTRYSVLYTANATVSGSFGYLIGRVTGVPTATSVNIFNFQIEDVTGQSNQAPSEYVPSTENSTGALGVKYFQNTNGNTVSNNIVTEATGTPLTTLKGILTEPSRTNLVWPSGYGVAGVTQTTAALTAAAYTLSFKGTGSVTGTGGFVGTLNGTGANNTVALTVTATAAAATLTVTGSITEMQLELGSNNSSVIPTTSAAVTRAADAATIPTAGNITTAAGTVYCEVYLAETPVNDTNIISESTGNRELLATHVNRTISITDGTNTVFTANAITVGTTAKCAVSWGAGGLNICLNGGTVATGSFIGAYSPFGASLYLNKNAAVTIFGKTPIKNLRTWTTQLSSAQLNALTR